MTRVILIKHLSSFCKTRREAEATFEYLRLKLKHMPITLVYFKNHLSFVFIQNELIESLEYL